MLCRFSMNRSLLNSSSYCFAQPCEMCLSDMWICVCACPCPKHVCECVKFTCEDKGLICTWLKHLLTLLCQAFRLEKQLVGFRGCVERKELLKSLSLWSFRVRWSRSGKDRGSHGKVVHVSSHIWVPAQWNTSNSNSLSSPQWESSETVKRCLC